MHPSEDFISNPLLNLHGKWKGHFAIPISKMSNLRLREIQQPKSPTLGMDVAGIHVQGDPVQICISHLWQELVPRQ